MNETPCAWSAIATAPLVTPMFAGVSGSVPATSSAGTMMSAAANGERMPSAAPTAVAAARRPAVESAIQARRWSAARGSRPSARNASSRWERRPPALRLRSYSATAAPTPAIPSSTKSGQSGIAPVAEPAMTSAASTSARATPSAANAPPVVHSRSRFGSAREKSPMRTASPARAGTSVFTSEPTP